MLTIACLLSSISLSAVNSDNNNTFILKKEKKETLNASKLNNIPTERINDIYQDEEGYVWIVTDNGITRYDGYSAEEFISLNNTDESYISLLHSIIEDKNGIFYIGTEKGLIQFDKYTGEANVLKNELVNDINVSSMVKDRQGRIWIGSDKGLMMKHADRDEFIRLNLKIDDKELSDITSLMLDDKDNLWITIWYRGLLRYDLNNSTCHHYKEKELERAYTLFQDSRNDIWVGTWGQGLIRIDGSKDCRTGHLSCQIYKHHVEQPNSLLDNTIYKIAEDRDGDIWIGNRSGLSILDRDAKAPSFRNYYPDNEDVFCRMPYNEVNCLLQTRDHAMFVGMTGGGIYKMNFLTGHEYERIDTDKIREAFKTSSVHGLLCTGNDELWMGLPGHGPILFNGTDQSFTTYKHMTEFEGFVNPNTVEDIKYIDDSTKICFASYNSGILLLDLINKSAQVMNSITRPALKDDRILSLCEDKDNNIWVGTMRGVFILNRELEIISLTDYLALSESNPKYKVLDIKCDPYNNIWCATNFDGIIKINNKDRKIESYYNTTEDNKDAFMSILADSKGRIWAGSARNGLFRYNPDTDEFVKIKELAFLESSGIVNIAEDHLGKIWVTTRTTVVSFQQDDKENFSRINYWDISEDDNSEFFNTSSTCSKTKDKMYFGTSKGVIGFPCQINKKENGVKPNIALTNLRNRCHQLNLHPGQSSFNIHFTLFNYNNKCSDIYKYRFYRTNEKPDNASWMIVNGLHNFASFKNIKPGHYYFEVYGYQTKEALISEPAILEINIPQNPWKTWWAICLYILLGTTLIGLGILSLYSWWKLSKQKAIDKISRRKAEELNRAKLQFFNNVSKDFMSPLNIIMASTDNITAHTEEEKELLRILSTNTIRLSRLVQQVLEFKTIDNGRHILKVSHHNLSRFAANCIDATIPLLKKNDLTIDFTSQPENILGWFDPEKLDKIIYNLILHARNYAQENSTITITLSMDGTEKVCLTCTHQGQLMSEKTLKKVFNKFYEHDSIDLDKIESSIGLSVVKPMVILHKGDIEAYSSEGIGNRFIITLPIGKESYTEEEIEETSISLSEVNIQMALNNNEAIVKQDYNILNVESDDEYREFLNLILGKRYNVTSCETAEDAIALLESHDFDLVVTDAELTGMSGIEFCNRLKNDIAYSHIPVIIISDSRDDCYKIEGFNCGADGYLTRQTNYSVLIALISNFMKKREKQSATFKKQMVLEVQDIEYTSMDKQFLQQTIDVVNLHLGDADFGLPEFSKEMSMSRTILTDKLKRLTGMTPISFILNARLTAAYRIATSEESCIRVSDLAYSLGFNDPKYFSKRFKIKYGVSPKTLMENKKNKTQDI